MALLRYLKPANGLPDPKGSLSTMISLDVIAEMNKEVEEASRSVAGGKRGHFPSEKSPCLSVPLSASPRLASNFKAAQIARRIFNTYT